VPKVHQSTQAVIQAWEEFQREDLAPLGMK
jgi:hypothetical protein